MRIVLLALLSLGTAAAAAAQSLVGLTRCCPNEVVTVDLAAGDTTVVAAIGTASDGFVATVGSLALDAEGRRAFLVRNGDVVRMDLDTGETTTVGSGAGITQLAGVDVGRDQLLAFTAERDPSVPAPGFVIDNYVVGVDLATGDTTRIARVGRYTSTGGPPGGDLFATVAGPAVATATHLYTIRNLRLVSVDLGTGTVVEAPAPLTLPELVGVDAAAPALYRTARAVETVVVGPDTLDAYTGRLLRLPILPGGTVGVADTVGVYSVATVNPRTGATTGDSYLASFGVAFYDAAGDRVLLNRNGRLVEVDLGSGAVRDRGAAGRVRYVPAATPGVVSAETPASEAELQVMVAPNPAVGGVRVRVLGSEAARIEVLDRLGRRVALLHDGLVSAEGARWATADVAPGVYLVRATTATGVRTARVTVVR